jgi:hypothetical protein
MPDVCEECGEGRPVVIKEDKNNEKKVWICMTCLEEYDPKIYNEVKLALETTRLNELIPGWVQQSGEGS